MKIDIERIETLVRERQQASESLYAFVAEHHPIIDLGGSRRIDHDCDDALLALSAEIRALRSRVAELEAIDGCPHCSRPIAVGQRFCASCGLDVVNHYAEPKLGEPWSPKWAEVKPVAVHPGEQQVVEASIPGTIPERQAVATERLVAAVERLSEVAESLGSTLSAAAQPKVTVRSATKLF